MCHSKLIPFIISGNIHDILPVTPMAICLLLLDCCNCIFWCVFKSNKDGFWNAIGKQRWLLDYHRKIEMAFGLIREAEMAFGLP